MSERDRFTAGHRVQYVPSGLGTIWVDRVDLRSAQDVAGTATTLEYDRPAFEGTPMTATRHDLNRVEATIREDLRSFRDEFRSDATRVNIALETLAKAQTEQAIALTRLAAIQEQHTKTIEKHEGILLSSKQDIAGLKTELHGIRSAVRASAWWIGAIVAGVNLLLVVAGVIIAFIAL